MTYSNHDSQRFSKLRAAVEAVPDNLRTGTGWRDTPLVLPAPVPEQDSPVTAEEVERRVANLKRAAK